jgi:5-methylcytosine-specific restriction endonuclease McrA
MKEHAWSCECRECLGVDYDRYHHIISRDEYAERDAQD